jgi:hypothetical protein
MPQSALSAVEVDYCIPGRDIASLLVRLVGNADVPGHDETRLEG